MNSSKPTILVLVALLGCSVAAAERRIPTVAVFPLVAQGMDNSSASILTDALSDELLKSGKVRVMERTQMETILREQGFQKTGSCDQNECAVEMGKVLGIERIVVGTAGRLGESHTISVRAVDVASGEVLASDRRVIQGSIDKLLTEELPPLARSLANRLAGGVDATNTASGKPSEAPRETRIWPWVLGGTVVAGGAAVAVLLLGSKGSSSNPSAPVTTDFNATW
jgi:TolB-like protein